MNWGRELVFSQLPNEVAELILQNANYQLNKIKETPPQPAHVEMKKMRANYEKRMMKLKK